jgi:hypothetical protein
VLHSGGGGVELEDGGVELEAVGDGLRGPAIQRRAMSERRVSSSG